MVRGSAILVRDSYNRARRAADRACAIGASALAFVCLADAAAFAQSSRASEAPSSALEAFTAHPIATAGLALAFLLLGGFLGQAVRRRATAEGPPPTPTRAQTRRPTEAPASRESMIFRAETDEGVSRQRLTRAEREAIEESETLFDYFEDRFGIAERRSAAVAAYLDRVASAIDRLQEKLIIAEQGRDRAVRAAAGGSELQSPRPEPAASMRLVMDGVRTARSAMQVLRTRGDDDFTTFAAETDLEESLRRAAGLYGAVAAGGALDPNLIDETWPHQLWRAEALLGAYFPSDGAWGDLRDGAAAAAVGLRRALREAGVLVAHVRLLQPLRAGDGEAWADTLGGLSRLEAVRILAAKAGDDAVLDCESFGYVDRARSLKAKSRLIVRGGQ